MTRVDFLTNLSVQYFPELSILIRLDIKMNLGAVSISYILQFQLVQFTFGIFNL